MLLPDMIQALCCVFWARVFHVFYMTSCTAAGNAMAVSHLQINML